MENVALVSLNNRSMNHPAPRTISRTPTGQHQDPPLPRKLLAAGTAACMADLCTFPLDTAKVRLQIQGESLATGSLGATAAGRLNVAAYHTSTATAGSAATSAAQAARYRGVFGTILTISRVEGPRALYNGIIPGLQRQMAFASIRIGLYDTVKHQYNHMLGSAGIGVRILAGITTGATAVLAAQPTDVVKVRMQAAKAGEARYSGSIAAYRSIARHEGIRGLWKGTSPNVARTTIVNACELVSYDIIKEKILTMRILSDNMPCHFVSACGAGFITTVVASPVDVIKTRYMNSGPGTYRGIADCATKMFQQEGPGAFYKGFMPSFLRLASWNIVMFVCYEQLKRALADKHELVVPQIDMRLPKTQTA